MDSKIKKHATIKGFFISVPILLAIVLLVQCKNKNTDINCNAMLVTVMLNLRHPDGQPVVLDSATVFWVSQNQFVEHNPFWWESNRQWGAYTIVSDLMRRELRGKQEIMRFTGYINDEVVFKRDLLVGTDYCHVKYLGTEPLTVVVEGISDAVRDQQFCELISTERIQDLIPFINVFVSAIDDDVSHEGRLQMIVDWFLSRSCIIDAYIDCVLCVPPITSVGIALPNNSRIAFSFIENGETVNMFMIAYGRTAHFMGFISE